MKKQISTTLRLVFFDQSFALIDEDKAENYYKMMQFSNAQKEPLSKALGQVASSKRIKIDDDLRIFVASATKIYLITNEEQLQITPTESSTLAKSLVAGT